MPNQKLKNKLLDALNNLDELATEYTRDGDLKEQKSQEKDYNFLHDFIIKMFNKEL